VVTGSGRGLGRACGRLRARDGAKVAFGGLNYSAKGIRINAVSPGSMWTPALRETAEQSPRHVERLSVMTPLGRLAEPEEVAEAAAWLCTPRTSYVLGHAPLADGGAVLG
jgi:NAD(P)-dependent dehydrogenase (short-subunit alcohol dehydrogenase family)